MRKAAPPPRLSFRTYQHLLAVFGEGAMILVRRVSKEFDQRGRESPPVMDVGAVTRNFCILSGLVRRSIVVSRYIATLPVPTEEREHRLGPALDRVLRLFAARKITAEEYHRSKDAELDGDDEDEFEDSLLDDDDEAEREYDPDADVPGRPPSVLVAELCRDLGMVSHALPPQWLTPLPAELRLLCARAAAAAIRPSAPAVRGGRAMAR